MRTENFLNTLILSLSVSTVLITLLSYLIYKLKQFPKSQDQSVQPRKKEGVFFRRHIPGEVVARENESQKTAVPSKLARFNTMPWYFGILALIIFCSIFFKDIFGTSYSRWVRKKEVSELEALRASGLLKSYDFDPSIKSESPTEAIPETYRSWVDQKIEHLKKYKFIVFAWDNNQKLNPVFQKSTEAWIDFLKKHDLSVEKVTTLDEMGGDIFILPQAKSLSKAQKDFLDTLIKSKRSILFTGPCGLLDGTGEKSQSAYCEEIFSFKFRPSNEKLLLPTVFASRRNPGWIMPPGLLLNWFPEDSSVQTVLLESESASSFEAKFTGKLNEIEKAKSIRSLFTKFNDAKLGWMALGPLNIPKTSKSDTFYSESALIDVLSWLSPLHIEIAHWKKEMKSGMVISVDSESMFENAKLMWKIFKRQNIPATFFVVADYSNGNGSLNKIDPSIYEIGSHSLDHSIFSKMDLPSQFNNMQESRLILEENFKQPVLGFHPPEERFDNHSLNAALQNGFKYFVGDQNFYRMSPLFLQGGLIYFPRALPDDVQIKRNRSLISNQEILEVLNSGLAQASLLGGIYFLNTHTQIMGEGFYLEILEDFTKQEFPTYLWKLNFKQLISWWERRAQLEFRIASDHILFRNSGKLIVEDLEIFVNGRSHGLTLGPNEEKKIPTK